MSIEKLRKNATTVATAVVLVGTLFIICIGISVFTLRDEFSTVLQVQQPSQGMVSDLIEAMKGQLIMNLAFCVLLITSGGYMLYYLRKERKANGEEERGQKEVNQ